MDIRKRGATSQMVNLFIPDNSVTTGAGVTGLTSASTNLCIAVRRELSSTETVYHQADGDIEAQTTIGTFQAPSTSAKCRFKETPNAGQYEIQFHDDAGHFGSADASEKLFIRVYEASTTALKIGPNTKEIQLTAFDLQTASTPQTGDSYAIVNGDHGLVSVQDDIDTLLARIVGTLSAGSHTAQSGDSYAIVNGDHGLVSIQDDIDTVLARLIGTILAGNHNAQSGDSFARLGAPAGASVSADIANIIADLGVFVPTTDAADSATLTTGTAIAGTYVKTQTDDNDRYILAPVNPGGLDLTLDFALGLGRSPVSISINGYWSGAGQYCDVYAYDYVIGVWDKLSNSTTRMTPKAADNNYVFILNREHIDPATGNVSIRFVSTSTNTAHRLNLDRVLVASINSSGGDVPGITAEDVWTYAKRELTSSGGEPVDTDAIADAVWDEEYTGHTGPLMTGLLLSGMTTVKTATDKLDRLIEADGGDYRFNANALEEAPTGGAAPTVEDIATRLLENPANKLETDANGYVTANVSGDVTVTGVVTLAAAQPNYAPSKAGDAMTLTAGERTSVASSVWAAGARTLTSFGTLVSDIWNNAVRTLTAFAFTVMSTVTDKTGFSLTAAYDAAKTAAQVSDIPTTAEIADKFIGRNIAGGADGGRTVKQVLQFNRNRVVVDLIANTLVVYAEDDVTIAWQGTVSSSNITKHIIGVDPA